MITTEPLKHEELDVPNALKPFVARRMRTWSEAPVDFVMPLPPTGSLFLTLVFGDPMTLEFKAGELQPAPQLFIGGQLRDTMPVSRIQGYLGITGFEFTPTGFYRLFHRDCQTFTDRATALQRLMPDAAAVLLERLGQSEDVGEQIEWLQSFLLEQVPFARPASVVDEAVARVEEQHGDISVAELARRSHLSQRQLNRRFLKEVGVGPKHFAKVIQIKQVLAALQHGTTGQLQELAQRAGYFDQSHFIKDFQRLVGTNPLVFLEAGESFLRTYMKQRA